MPKFPFCSCSFLPFFCAGTARRNPRSWSGHHCRPCSLSDTSWRARPPDMTCRRAVSSRPSRTLSDSLMSAPLSVESNSAWLVYLQFRGTREKLQGGFWEGLKVIFKCFRSNLRNEFSFQVNIAKNPSKSFFKPFKSLFELFLTSFLMRLFACLQFSA